MKNILITMVALALCVSAQAQERTLSTTDGATYTGITRQRIEPDGVYIEYTLPGGGIGMSKVKFSRLSRAQQKQFGLTKYRARDYAAEVAQANDDAAQELTQRYETERDARIQRDAENQRAYPARMAEMARLNAAQAAVFNSSTAAEPAPKCSLEYSALFTAGRDSSQTTHSHFSGDLFPNRGFAKPR